MNCHYHPDRETKVQCSGCNQPLCDQCSAPQKDGSYKCSRCIAVDAAREAAEGIDQRMGEKARKVQDKEARREIRKRVRLVFQAGVILICLVIIFFQLYPLLSESKDAKPLRHGSYETDEQTDRCINALWQIAQLLQKDKLPGDNILCPRSKMPFVIEETNSDIIVRAPKPELYGFKNMQVSKKYPVPELVK
ncbi:hypothetical protein ACFL0H_00985 [Thermodesulfobacteriota bacterium]